MAHLQSPGNRKKVSRHRLLPSGLSSGRMVALAINTDASPVRSFEVLTGTPECVLLLSRHIQVQSDRLGSQDEPPQHLIVM